MRIRPILIALVLMLALPAAASATSVYGSISGTVSLDGHGSANLCATAYDGDTAVGFANTDSGGDYQLTGLYPAQYTVKFDDCGPGYSTTQWFNHVSSRQS